MNIVGEWWFATVEKGTRTSDSQGFYRTGYAALMSALGWTEEAIRYVESATVTRFDFGEEGVNDVETHTYSGRSLIERFSRLKGDIEGKGALTD